MDIISSLITGLLFIAGLAAYAGKAGGASIYSISGDRRDSSSLPDAEQFRIWTIKLHGSDESAFTEMFRTMYNPLLLFALKFVPARAEAKDILQDTFVKVWDIRAQLDPDKSLKALLYMMVRNTCLNHIKAKKGVELTENITRTLEDNQPLPGESKRSADELESHIANWIQELPERQQEAFELSRFDGLNHNEIAEVMDCKPRTVNNHIVNALNTLRSKVGRYIQERE